MSFQVLRIPAAALLALFVPVCRAQVPKPVSAEKGASATATTAADAKLVVVPAVVYDKKGLVTSLTQNDFSITVDGKPQAIRYFGRDADVPLTVGLLVDVSPSQSSVIDDEQKASQKFLDSFLQAPGANRPADKAFVLQFAHTAELLQDVTASRPLLAAGLKQIGTQAPGSPDEDTSTQSTTTSNPGGSNNPTGGNNPNGGGYGPYGRRGGYPGGNGGGGSNGGGSNGGGSNGGSQQARSGNVLYDSLFLASDDLLSKQKGRRALVVLTDGVDRHSKESLTEAIEAAQRADTVVYAIYYKGREPRDFRSNPSVYDPYDRGGYDPYGGGYDPYGRYPPTTGGSTSPGTYKDPDGKKILTRICTETGGRVFELKGKGSLDDIYKQIGDELRAQYRLGFTPSYEAGGSGYHPIQLTLTNPASKNLGVQTRNGYYTGEPKAHP